MNRLIINSSQEVKENQFVISDEMKVKHIHEVLGSKVGDQIKATLLNEGLCNGVIKDLSTKKVTIEIEDLLERPEQNKVHLIVGLSRPPTIKKILEHATCMGVESFTFFVASKSEKSYKDSKIFEKQSLENLLELGVSQSSKLYKLPKVEVLNRCDFEVFCKKSSQNFLLSPFAQKSFKAHQIKENLTLAIGPERGWTKEEEMQFIEHGFSPIKLSDNTLRVEIATFSALAQIDLLLSND